MSRLVDTEEMQSIYDSCIRVFNGEISANAASKALDGKTHSSQASRIMYFSIYSAMRRGVCYKKGTSASFTRFLIENIYKDNGLEAFLSALSAAKQNAEYRISCGNEQPGIEATCRELIDKYSLPVSYEELEQYNGTNRTRYEKMEDKSKAHSALHQQETEMTLSISYGGASFEATGTLESVMEQLNAFSSKILPTISTRFTQQMSDTQRANETPRRVNQSKRKSSKTERISQVSIGRRIREKYPEIVRLTQKMDFKARMIPLLFLADQANYQTEFSINDIQTLMQDALNESPEKKQIGDVFSRRPDWFERVNQNPRRYKLLDIARDYARNILNEWDSFKNA